MSKILMFSFSALVAVTSASAFAADRQEFAERVCINESDAAAKAQCIEEVLATVIDQVEPGKEGYNKQYKFRPLCKDGQFDNCVQGAVRPLNQQKSDAEAVIGKITGVRNQASRGTCAIFAATAEVEAMLTLTHCRDPKYSRDNLDLSEEWLEYMAMRGRSGDGSSSTTNFGLYKSNGFLDETDWAYVGETWTAADLTRANVAKVCGKVSASAQPSCLLGHRDTTLLGNPRVATLDPELDALIKKAATTKPVMAGINGSYFVRDEDEVKNLLLQGIPVVLEVDFYFGAWNHRLGPTHGIPRNQAAFDAGEVGYPFSLTNADPSEIDSVTGKAPPSDSKDFVESQKDREGHAILLVGYDDNATMETSQLLEDGTTAKITYKGVYYFKNSWGTSIFGTKTEIGSGTYPGFGKITQKYAHDFGQFYKLPMKFDSGCEPKPIQ